MYVNMIIKQERDRLILLEQGYYQEISTLPKGSISRKKQGNQYYYYLQRREDKKIIVQYLGKEESDFSELKEQINRRKHLEVMIKTIKKEIKTANKILGE